MNPRHLTIPVTILATVSATPLYLVDPDGRFTEPSEGEPGPSLTRSRVGPYCRPSTIDHRPSTIDGRSGS
jgi:hypothetical protein